MENLGRYLTVKKAANYTSLSEATIRRLMADNRLTKCRPPGIDAVLVDRLEIDKVLHGETVGSAG
jgi:excisionase family DNA binding protein